jgi:ATP-binding cassette, subfamily B, bacterial
MTMSERPPTSVDPSTVRILRRAIRLVGPYRGQVRLLVAVIFVSSVLAVVNPLLTKVVFDQALFPTDGERNLTLLAVVVAAMIAIVAANVLLAVAQTYLSSRIGQHVMHDLRDRLYGHLQRMSLRFFTAARTGEIQARMSQDVGGLGTIVGEAAPSVVGNVLFFAVSIIAMTVLAWQLTLVTLAVLPAFLLISIRVGRERRRLASRTQQSVAELNVIAEQTLSVSGMLLTKVFDRERDALERYRAESANLADLGMRQQIAGRTLLGLAQTFFLVGPAFVYLVAGFALPADELSPGTLVAFTALQMRLFFPMRDLLERSIQIQTSLALFERVFQYLDLTPDIVDSPTARPLAPADVRGRIAFRDVSFRYADVAQPSGNGTSRRLWALENVSFTIEPGQLAAIVGPSGAGKTTATYLIARLYDVTDGAVEIDGVDVREIQLGSLAAFAGMVSQETTLFHASIRENLLFARPGASDEELEAAARAAFIHDRILELDDGYETLVGERGYRMSGGEKQRLAIARAILKDPRILILDEATSALDTASERLVQRALEPLIAQRTTIAIAHRLSTILAADVILVLDRGRLVETGTHAELVARGGLYAQVYEEQFHGSPMDARGGHEAGRTPGT